MVVDGDGRVPGGPITSPGRRGAIRDPPLCDFFQKRNPLSAGFLARGRWRGVAGNGGVRGWITGLRQNWTHHRRPGTAGQDRAGQCPGHDLGGLFFFFGKNRRSAGAAGSRRRPSAARSRVRQEPECASLILRKCCQRFLTWLISSASDASRYRLSSPPKMSPCGVCQAST